MNSEKTIQLLKKEMVVAMGCTEPAASALAGNKARQLLGCMPERVVAYASRDMVKNTMAVGIPNCSDRGLLTAVCLGVCSESGIHDLSILSDVNDAQRAAAAELLARSQLELVENVPPVYVKVVAYAGENKASCTVSLEHDHFSEMTVNDRVLLREEIQADSRAEDDLAKYAETLTLEEILKFAHDVNPEDVAFVLDAAKTNLDLADYSLKHDYGLKIASTVLADIPQTPTTLSEAMTLACAYAAAGSDARMSGCPRAVVINSGSGNQGITCTVPLLILGQYLGCRRETLLQALCISELVGLMITAKKDRLSALCGAFTAAMGTGCGMIHLMNGGMEQMDLMVRTMVGNLSGIVCDGAKNSCALKIYSSLQATCLAVRMAFKGEAPGKESGIIGSNAMESIDNLMNMCHEGMVKTDHTILSIMLDKQA